MSLKDLIRRAQRTIVERRNAPATPTVDFWLPPNGRDFSPPPPASGRAVPNGPRVHLVDLETGRCGVGGCTREHRLPGPEEREAHAGAGDAGYATMVREGIVTAVTAAAESSFGALGEAKHQTPVGAGRAEDFEVLSGRNFNES